MKTITSLAYNTLIGVNGIFLVLGAYDIATFFGILAILYSVSKLIPTNTK